MKCSLPALFSVLRRKYSQKDAAKGKGVGVAGVLILSLSTGQETRRVVITELVPTETSI